MSKQGIKRSKRDGMRNGRVITPPGIDGTWRDSCVLCMKGTDTGIALEAQAEFAIAGIANLGVPLDQATFMVYDVCAEEYGCDFGYAPLHDIEMGVLLCAKCAKHKRVPRIGLRYEGFPLYRQGNRMRE